MQVYVFSTPNASVVCSCMIDAESPQWSGNVRDSTMHAVRDSINNIFADGRGCLEGVGVV